MLGPKNNCFCHFLLATRPKGADCFKLGPKKTTTPHFLHACCSVERCRSFELGSKKGRFVTFCMTFGRKIPFFSCFGPKKRPFCHLLLDIRSKCICFQAGFRKTTIFATFCYIMWQVSRRSAASDGNGPHECWGTSWRKLKNVA